MDNGQLDNGLYQKERRFTLNVAILDGLLIIFFLQAINGPLFTKFWLKIGANQGTIGVITGLLWGMQVFSPLGSVLMSFFKSRKLLAAITGFVGRLCILAVVSMRYFMPENPPIPLMITIFAIGCFWLAINNAAWPALMAEVIPKQTGARYIVWRTSLMTIVGTILTVASGIFLDKTGDTIQNIQIVLLMAISGGLLGAISLFFYKEPRTIIENVNLRQAYIGPFSNINYKKFLYYAFFINLAITMMIPIQNTYFFNSLKINLTVASAYFAVASLISAILGILISKYIDIAGNKPILYMSTLVAGVFMPLFLILASDKVPWLIYFAAPFEAFIIGIVTPCIYCLAMKTTPASGRFVYMAMFAGAVGLGGGLGGFLSGPVFHILNQFQFTFLGIDWNGHRLMFLFISAVRVSSVRALGSIVEENAWSVKQTVKYVLATVFRRRKSDLNE